MSPTSLQTLRLGVGRHRTPEEGVCAMELSSMLAGQRFSDRPTCVCPVVAAFLRGYNDTLPDDLRHARLLRWASEAVGTRSRDPREVQGRALLLERFVRATMPRRLRAQLLLSRPPGDRDGRSEALGRLCGCAVTEDSRLADAVARVLGALCATEHADYRWERPSAAEDEGELLVDRAVEVLAVGGPAGEGGQEHVDERHGRGHHRSVAAP